MNTFTRMDKKDFERLIGHDRWSAGSVANMIINTKMERDGSFSKHYWRDDAQQRFRTPVFQAKSREYATRLGIELQIPM